jgi:alpha-beta hydrolase superfamily lysophospholipase
VTHVWIEGAGHEVKNLRGDPREDRVVDAVAGWLASLA